MTFTALINIMPLKELLDPQGKAVVSGLKKLDIREVTEVRIGKHITMQIEAADKESAWKVAEEACQKLLANQVMEYFEVVIK